MAGVFMNKIILITIAIIMTLGLTSCTEEELSSQSKEPKTSNESLLTDPIDNSDTEEVDDWVPLDDYVLDDGSIASGHYSASEDDYMFSIDFKNYSDIQKNLLNLTAFANMCIDSEYINTYFIYVSAGEKGIYMANYEDGKSIINLFTDEEYEKVFKSIQEGTYEWDFSSE